MGPERQIEQYLRAQCKERNWLCWKMQSSSLRGFPDRMVVTWKGEIYFVEIKTETGSLSKVQRVAITQLQNHGANTFVAVGREGVDKFLDWADSRERRRQ